MTPPSEGSLRGCRDIHFREDKQSRAITRSECRARAAAMYVTYRRCGVPSRPVVLAYRGLTALLAVVVLHSAVKLKAHLLLEEARGAAAVEIISRVY